MGQKLSTSSNNNINSSIEQDFVCVPSTKTKLNNLNNSENFFENIETMEETISLENDQDDHILDEVLKSIQESVKIKCSEIDSKQLQSIKLKPSVQKKYNKIDHTQLRSAKLKLKPTTQNKYNSKVNVSEEKVNEVKINEVKAPQPSEAPRPLQLPKVPQMPVMSRNETTKPFPRTLKEYYGVHEKKVKFLKKD